MPNLVERYLFTISPDHFFFAFKICIFDCLHFFSFSLTYGSILVEKLQTTSPLKVHNRFTSKMSCMLPRRVSTKVVYRLVKFNKDWRKLIVIFKFQKISNFGFFPFFSLSLTCDHMGEKNFKRFHLSESTHQICSKNLRHTPRKGLYQSCIKNCEISNFGFFCSV